MRPPDATAPCAPRAAPAPGGRGGGSRGAVRGGPPDRRDLDTSPTREARPPRRGGAGPPTRGLARHQGHVVPAPSAATLRNSPRAWRSGVLPRGHRADRSAAFFFRASQGALETPRIHVETKPIGNPRQPRPYAERRVRRAQRRHKGHHRIAEFVGAVWPAFPRHQAGDPALLEGRLRLIEHRPRAPKLPVLSPPRWAL